MREPLPSGSQAIPEADGLDTGVRALVRKRAGCLAGRLADGQEQWDRHRTWLDLYPDPQFYGRVAMRQVSVGSPLEATLGRLLRNHLPGEAWPGRRAALTVRRPPGSGGGLRGDRRALNPASWFLRLFMF